MPGTLLPGSVQSAAAGLSGFDVNSPLSSSAGLGFKNAGYDFCIRYIPRTAALIAGNLTNEEALGILNIGVALMPVQHVPLPGWQPNTNLGTIYGNYAATGCIRSSSGRVILRWISYCLRSSRKRSMRGSGNCMKSGTTLPCYIFLPGI